MASTGTPTTKVVAVMLAAALAAVAAPSSAIAAATLTQVPYPIDSSNQAGWWSPLETYVGGSEYAYLAFNEPGTTSGAHKVAIARRDGAGSWTRLPVMNGTTQAEYADDDGHNQPSIARDGSSYLHVFASMHNNTWRYFRSDTVGGAPQNHSADLPDQGGLVTYPVLTTAPNGDVYLICRVDDGNGSSRSGRLYRWSNSARTWSRVAVFARSVGRAVYPDDLQVDSAGNLHLLWEWSAYPSSGYRHLLSYLVYRPGTGDFADHTGTAVTLPVSTATADVVQPLDRRAVPRRPDQSAALLRPQLRSPTENRDRRRPPITESPPKQRGVRAMPLRPTRLLAAAVLLGCTAVTAFAAAPAHADPPGTGYTLAFHDEFDGTTVDTSKWSYRTDMKAYSAQRPENVSVSGGLMSIALKQETFAGKNFTGGGLVSKQRLRYGYYETRAKINDGSGWHSSFWLMAGSCCRILITPRG